MAFSTIEDDQWFTALPVDLTTDAHDRDDDQEYNGITSPEPQDDVDCGGAERVVPLPAAPAGPVWAAALDGYRINDVDGAAVELDLPVDEHAPQRSWIRRHRSSMAVAGSLATVIALIGGAALLLTNTGDNERTVAVSEPVDPHSVVADVSTSTPSPSSAAALSAEQWCARQGGGTRALVSSTEPDLAAIARIEDAYYVSRDIAAARAQLTAGIDLDPGAFEAAVAAIPVGTDHCVLTSPLGPSQYRVTVIERRPGGEEKRFTSAMTVQATPGHATASISGIGQVPQ